MVSRRAVLSGLVAAGAAAAWYQPALPEPATVLPGEPWEPAPAERTAHSIVNKTRRDADVEPLAWDAEIAAVARDYATTLLDADHFAHVGPDGSTPQERMKRVGCYTGENIAQRELVTAAAPDEIGKRVAKQWRMSTEHVENMTDPRHRREGIGIAKDGDRVVGVQNFC